ncbi:MAG TPA: hypothetical protein ACQGQH_10340 [Xylella sp.]
MFPMTVTIHDQAQLNALMAALATDRRTPAQRPHDVGLPQDEASQATNTPQAAATSAPVQAAPPPAAASVTTPGYNEALIALKDLAVAQGREAVTLVLNQFGIAKLSDADPARFPEVIALCKRYPDPNDCPEGQPR